MAALVIIDSQDLARLVASLVKEGGYQNFVTNYRPAGGSVGDTHWPTKDALPPNTLYHPSQDARLCCSEVHNHASYYGMSLDRVLGFDTPHWHVISDNPNFDNDKPGVKWEDFPENSGQKG